MTKPVNSINTEECCSIFFSTLDFVPESYPEFALETKKIVDQLEKNKLLTESNVQLLRLFWTVRPKEAIPIYRTVMRRYTSGAFASLQEVEELIGYREIIYNKTDTIKFLKNTIYPSLNAICCIESKNNKEEFRKIFQNHVQAYHWQSESSKKLSRLNRALYELFDYGRQLLNEDDNKGNIAIGLALDLKAKLQTFIIQPTREQKSKWSEFNSGFLQTLHSQDNVMNEHRARWKILIRNTAIALSIAFVGLAVPGFGALSVVISLVIVASTFFAKTTRQKQVAGVENEFQKSFVSVR